VNFLRCARGVSTPTCEEKINNKKNMNAVVRPHHAPARLSPGTARQASARHRARLAVVRTAPTDAPTVAAPAESAAQSVSPPPPTPAPSTSSSAPAPPAPSFTLTLPAPAVRAGLRISEIWDGTAPRIVVTAVADELAAAGIRPGLRLVSLPHPTLKGERWVLSPGNAPLSRVRDLIRVTRSVSLDLEFSVDPIPDEAVAAWVEAQEKAAAERAAGEEEEEEEDGGESTSAAAPSLPDVSTAPPSYVPPPAAVEYERQARALAKRLSARAARNAAEEARDDTPLLVGAAVAFLGPAAAILGWAYFSGFLDSLASHQY
jgi:hypothetical protein